MISKACYKPHTIFLPLPVKDCLCIDIVEINFLIHCRNEKKYLHEQFIRLVEIPFYVIYFPESASSIRRRQKMF